MPLHTLRSLEELFSEISIAASPRSTRNFASERDTVASPRTSNLSHKAVELIQREDCPTLHIRECKAPSDYPRRGIEPVPEANATGAERRYRSNQNPSH